MSFALVQPPTIEFIQQPHKYVVDGREVRSWSSIAKAANLLPDLDGVPIHILANAAGRGAQVDQACSLIMEGGGLERDILAMLPDEERRKVYLTETKPYVEAYREWWGNWWDKWNPGEFGLSVQTPLYCRSLDFCCTPDFHTEQSVNDLKATDKCSRTWGLQTAAQYLAHGDALWRRIIWLRPKLKRQQVFVFHAHEENRRIFSALDLDVVRAACEEDFDADCIKRWRAGE